MRRIVVVGSGFAGLQIAQQLAEEFSLRRGLHLTVVTDRSHFLFTPLWNFVATGQTNLAQIAIPLSKILDDEVDVVIDRAIDVDLDGREVIGEHHRYPYDFLALALGAETDWRGHPEFEEVVRPCKSGRDAVDIHEAVDHAFERARMLSQPADRRHALTFTIAGGGPTGVELMARLASRLERDVLQRDENRALAESVRLVLVEPRESLLPEFDADLQPIALDHLRGAGVEVRLGESVVSCSAKDVGLSGGDTLGCETTIWCGGVRPPRWLEPAGFDTDRLGRVTAHRTLQAVGHHNVYVAGDIAGMGDDVPMKASVAATQAEIVARNIIADLSGRSRREWSPEERGSSLVSLGRSNAVVTVRGMLLQGRPAQAVLGAMTASTLPAGVGRLTMIPALLGDALSIRGAADSTRLLSE